MQTGSAPLAIILGLSPTGLYAVRELGEVGIETVGFAREHGPASASRYLRSACVVESKEAIDHLISLAPPNSPKPILIPTSDQDVDLIQRNAGQLAQYFVFQASYADGVAERLMTKDKLYALCREVGIAIPKSWDLERREVALLRSKIHLPCLIKPSRIDAVKAAMSGRKLWTCRNQVEFAAAANALPEGDTRWLVQEIIPGPESNITLWAAYRDSVGHVHQETTARKLRQFPPGFGSASLVRTELEPETAEVSRKLLAAADYQGIAATEFKRDPRDGHLKIIEMNPRPSLWFGVTSAAGKAIALATYRDLVGQDLPQDNQQLDNVQWRYWLKDLWSWAFYMRNPSFVLPPPDLAGQLSPSRRCLAVGSLKDPIPSLKEIGVFGRKAVRRIIP